MRFWNNLHQVRLKWKGWKAKGHTQNFSESDKVTMQWPQIMTYTTLHRTQQQLHIKPRVKVCVPLKLEVPAKLMAPVVSL